MSTDQPRHGSGDEPPGEDPFAKPPRSDPPGGGSPYGPPPSGGGSPYGPPDGGEQPPPSGEGERPGDAFGTGPHGGGGDVDPLAGMPPLASRGRRLVARIIDALIIGVPLALILWPLVNGAGADADDTGNLVAQIAYPLVYCIYEGLMLTTSGQTVGKKAMGIRVAMLSDGSLPRGRPGWFRAGVYSLPPLVPCCGAIFWFINVLSCTWDKPYRQCLHDKAARTVVVDAEPTG